jgi:hypothetical protein
MLPSVSVPRVAAASPTVAAIAEPVEEPDGSAPGQYGLVHWPPTEDHPEGSRPLQLAHSDCDHVFNNKRLRVSCMRTIFVLPKIIAPASRNFRMTVASLAG